MNLYQLFWFCKNSIGIKIIKISISAAKTVGISSDDLRDVVLVIDICHIVAHCCLEHFAVCSRIDVLVCLCHKFRNINIAISAHSIHNKSWADVAAAKECFIPHVGILETWIASIIQLLERISYANIFATVFHISLSPFVDLSLKSKLLIDDAKVFECLVLT